MSLQIQLYRNWAKKCYFEIHLYTDGGIENVDLPYHVIWQKLRFKFNCTFQPVRRFADMSIVY